jgi:hypothetical protein
VTSIVDHRRLNILLVEDDELDVMNIRRAFQHRQPALRRRQRHRGAGDAPRAAPARGPARPPAHPARPPVTAAAFVEIMATLNKYWSVNELP